MIYKLKPWFSIFYTVLHAIDYAVTSSTCAVHSQTSYNWPRPRCAQSSVCTPYCHHEVSHHPLHLYQPVCPSRRLLVTDKDICGVKIRHEDVHQLLRLLDQPAHLHLLGRVHLGPPLLHQGVRWWLLSPKLCLSWWKSLSSNCTADFDWIDMILAHNKDTEQTTYIYYGATECSSISLVGRLVLRSWKLIYTGISNHVWWRISS